MGTRSFIAIKTKQGFKGVYCHWDGYLEHNGQILNEHYISRKKVKNLIDHGDISILRNIVGRKHNFDNRDAKSTTFYGRDRGEKETGAKSFETLRELAKYAEDCGTEYVYLFDGKIWRYAERGMQMFGFSDGSKYREFFELAPKLEEMARDESETIH